MMTDEEYILFHYSHVSDVTQQNFLKAKQKLVEAGFGIRLMVCRRDGKLGVLLDGEIFCKIENNGRYYSPFGQLCVTIDNTYYIEADCSRWVVRKNRGWGLVAKNIDLSSRKESWWKRIIRRKQ